MATATKLAVDTRKFEMTWGWKPRGKGMWAFDLSGPSGVKRTHVTPSMAYGSAVKSARQRAAEIGADAIELLP